MIQINCWFHQPRQQPSVSLGYPYERKEYTRKDAEWQKLQKNHFWYWMQGSFRNLQKFPSEEQLFTFSNSLLPYDQAVVLHIPSCLAGQNASSFSPNF